MKLEKLNNLFWGENKFNDHVKIVHLFWCVFCVYVVTVVAKFDYLNALYVNGIQDSLIGIIDKPTKSKSTLLYFLFFTRDFFEVVVAIAIVFLFGHLKFGLKTGTLAFSSILFSLFFCVMNWFSVDQLKTLITFDTLQVSISWIFDNPALLEKYIRKRTLALVILSFLFCSMPLLVAWFFKSTLSEKFHRKAILGVFLIFIFSAACFFSFNAVYFFKTPLPFHGYWTSSMLSFVSVDKRNPKNIKFSDKEKILNDYKNIVFLNSSSSEKEFFPLSNESLRKRHVIIIGLESAPFKYYNLSDNEDLPGFDKFTNNGVVSDKHFSPVPFTSLSYYSILSGTYPPSFGIRIQYGDFKTDGLSNTLSEHGYVPTYIDSHVIDWTVGNPNSRVLKNLGFEKKYDNKSVYDKRTGPWRESTFEEKEKMEKLSFDRLKKELLEAEKNKTSAFIFLATIFGHYSWVAKPEFEHEEDIFKLNKIISSLDCLLNDFHEFLRENNLLDDVIVIITGDHGLRYKREFSALNENPRSADVAFKVPFVLFAPGLFSERFVPPYTTSHVDIAPTILELVGVSTNNLLLHGENILDSRLNARLVFLINTGLSPTNYLESQGQYLSFNSLTGETYVTTNNSFEIIQPFSLGSRLKKVGINSEKTIAEIFSEANSVFDQTGAYFFSRGKK